MMGTPLLFRWMDIQRVCAPPAPQVGVPAVCVLQASGQALHGGGRGFLLPLQLPHLLLLVGSCALLHLGGLRRVLLE